MSRVSCRLLLVLTLLFSGVSGAANTPDSTRVVYDPASTSTIRVYFDRHQSKDESGGSINYPDNVSLDPCSFPSDSSIWSIAVDTIINDTICTMITPLVGDLDGDGIAEIVCFSNRLVNGGSAISGGGNVGTKVRNVVVYDGLTYQRKAKFDLPSYVSAFEATPYGLARCQNGDALMVFACTDNKLYAYKISGGVLSQVWGSVSYGSGDDYATVVGFADFNNDGRPELYVRNKIFDLATGQMLLTVNSANRSATYAHIGALSAGSRKQLSASYACDIVGDTKCELLLGNEIHSINITNSNGTAGNSSTLYATAPSTGVSGITADGHAQVADFNLDGHLDVFISCRPAEANAGMVYGYVWDVFNNTVSTPIEQPVTQPGKSIPLIADIDNDGTPEVVLHCGVPGENVRAYKYNAATHSFSLFWTKGFVEDSYSNSLTLFDFNQDGESELLICDENNISIVNGSTPALVQNAIATFPFKEVTIMQYPVVADVNNDGAAEIVFVGNETAKTIQGSLNVLRSGGEPWAPARPVWNQYMYNITNVNKDLTIPAVQFNNAYAFVEQTATGPVQHRPYNNFLQQATNIDTNGVPYRVASDLIPGNFDFSITEEGFVVSMEYCNIGPAACVVDSIYTCIYADEHQGSWIANAWSYHTDGTDIVIPSGGCYSTGNFLLFPLEWFCASMPFDSLTFAINDRGYGVGEGGVPQECNYENNFITFAAHMEQFVEEYYDTICAGQSYEQHGFYIEGEETAIPGDYQASYSDPDDCRYVYVLNLHVVGSGTIDTALTVCDAFVWQGEVYTESQDVTISESVGGACDQIVTIHLTVNHSDTTHYEEQTVCDSLVWHTRVYRTTGRYYFEGETPEGCLYRETLYLTVGHSEYVETSEVACDRYIWYGEELTESGDYTHDNGSSGDCQSVEVLHLTLYPSFYENEEVTLCQGSSVSVHGATVSTPGLYHYNFQTTHQCDSVYETLVVLRPSYFRVDTVSMCAGDPSVGYRWVDGETYYYSTETPECRLVTRYGCDSILRLNLSIDRSLRASIHCEPEFPTYENNHVCLTNTTGNSLMHRWYLFDGTMSEEDFCCFDIPFDLDSVVVRLVVSSLSGCYDTATLMIPMDRSSIYIPNAFTPNLSTNSVFKVYGNGILEALAIIYTREGMQLTSFDALHEGWDGTHDGERVPQGTYVYTVRYHTVWRPNEWQTVVGTVTLLR